MTAGVRKEKDRSDPAVFTLIESSLMSQVFHVSQIWGCHFNVVICHWIWAGGRILGRHHTWFSSESYQG